MQRQHFAICCAFAFVLAAGCSVASAQAPQPQVIRSAGNPILSDGSYYSADPAPIVVGDTLYILAGRDEALPNVNNFIMNEWQLFATKNVASKNGPSSATVAGLFFCGGGSGGEGGTG